VLFRSLRPTASTSLLQERVDPEAQTWRSRYFYLFQDKDTERKFADYQNKTYGPNLRRTITVLASSPVACFLRRPSTLTGTRPT